MSIAKLQKQYQQAQRAYVAGKRTPAHLRKIETLRKRIEAAELRSLGKRTRVAKKNFFGLGKGAPRASVERKKRSEAHRLLDQGHSWAARRVSRMSTRKYARKRGMKIEGRLRTHLRERREHARKQVHGLVDRMFGQNPAGLLPAVVEGLAIGSGIVASEKALEALSKKKATSKNPLPALLGALAQGAESAVGGTLGVEALKSVTHSGAKRRPMKKKKKAKKKAARRPRPRAKKKTGHNPKRSHTKAKRKVARVTHAVAVRGKIVDMGTHAQMKAKARNLRRAGLKAIIGKRAH